MHSRHGPILGKRLSQILWAGFVRNIPHPQSLVASFWFLHRPSSPVIRRDPPRLDLRSTSSSTVSSSRNVVPRLLGANPQKPGPEFLPPRTPTCLIALDSCQ